MELKSYSRPTCSKQPRRVDRRRCRQQALPSTCIVDTTIDLPWRNFPEFGARGNVPEGCILTFEGARISLQQSVGQVEGSPRAKASSIRPVVLIQYRRVTDRRTDGRTDKQTDRHDESIYRASIASRGKNLLLSTH